MGGRYTQAIRLMLPLFQENPELKLHLKAYYKKAFDLRATISKA